MYSFPDFKPVCCSTSSSNCYFLTCIQISQEAGQVVWYSRLMKIFHSCNSHSQRLWRSQWEQTERFFWNSLAILMIQQMLVIWSLVPLSFLNPAWTSGSSQFTYCWSLAWRILSITLLACEMSTIVRQFEHSLALPFFGIGMKTDLFQSYGYCWVLQICWRTGVEKCNRLLCVNFVSCSFK